MQPMSLTLSLPTWLAAMPAPGALVTDEAKMRFVIELARRNVEEGTGGPFAAAVFALDDHALVAAGVNRVVPERCAVAHAEVMAIALAGRALDSPRLTARDRAFGLVTSVEPCAMCLGAAGWSGVRALVIGARTEDAERIGFNEGLKPRDWIVDFERRGVRVTRDILRADAAAVLNAYRTRGGDLY